MKDLTDTKVRRNSGKNTSRLDPYLDTNMVKHSLNISSLKLINTLLLLLLLSNLFLSILHPQLIKDNKTHQSLCELLCAINGEGYRVPRSFNAAGCTPAKRQLQSINIVLHVSEPSAATTIATQQRPQQHQQNQHQQFMLQQQQKMKKSTYAALKSKKDEKDETGRVGERFNSYGELVVNSYDNESEYDEDEEKEGGSYGTAGSGSTYLNAAVGPTWNAQAPSSEDEFAYPPLVSGKSGGAVETAVSTASKASTPSVWARVTKGSSSQSPASQQPDSPSQTSSNGTGEGGGMQRTLSTDSLGLFQTQSASFTPSERETLFLALQAIASAAKHSRITNADKEKLKLDVRCGCIGGDDREDEDWFSTDTIKKMDAAEALAVTRLKRIKLLQARKHFVPLNLVGIVESCTHQQVPAAALPLRLSDTNSPPKFPIAASAQNQPHRKQLTTPTSVASSFAEGGCLSTAVLAFDSALQCRRVRKKTHP